MTRIGFDYPENLRSYIFDYNISELAKDFRADNGSAGIIVTNGEGREKELAGLLQSSELCTVYENPGLAIIVTPFSKEVCWLYQHSRDMFPKINCWLLLPDICRGYSIMNRGKTHYKELLAFILDRYCSANEAAEEVKL